MSSINTLHRQLVAALACGGLLATGAAHAETEGPVITGHIDVVSQYILRGASTTYLPFKPGFGNEGGDAPESDQPTLQWGADWVHPSGVYLGYFGSQVNYSYKRLGESYRDRSILDFRTQKSIENDIYGGYTGKFGDFGYTAGLTGYVYINGKHANAVETKFALSYGNFNVTSQTLLNDVVWGNQGDTYWTLGYAQPMPYNITLNASLGYYTYKKEGKYLGTVDTAAGSSCPAGQSFAVNGCFEGGAPESGAFRHLIIGFLQPIGGTGFTWGLQGLIAGDNRFGVKQGNKLLGSLSYLF